MPEIVKLAENVTLYCGECEDVLPTLAPVSAVVTDPPYGLSFMGKAWDYDIPGADTWAAVLRALRPGGHLLAFAGTRTQHRMASAIEDAGFEIRDLIAWVYGEGFPKSHNISKAIDKAAGVRGHDGTGFNAAGIGRSNGGDKFRSDHPDYVKPSGISAAAKQWDGWGTALKPSHEPITWAIKPLTVVPYGDIIRAESNIGSLICLSLSCVKYVESLLLLNRRECEGGAVSVRLIAAVHRGVSNVKQSGEMDIFKSPEMAKIILSIVESWSSILVAACEHPSKFTMSMATRLTTALKTFNCLISETIRGIITPEEGRMLGRFMSARIVGDDSSGEKVSQAERISVQEIVTLLMESSIVDIAVPIFMPAAKAGSSVLLDAITGIGESVIPANEPITLARRPFKGPVFRNVLEHGTGALNIDACRVEGGGGGTKCNNRDKNGRCMGHKNAGRSTSGETFHGPEGKEGADRWPANIIHDGSPEAVKVFPDGSSRFFYCAKASMDEREFGCENIEARAQQSSGARTYNDRCGNCGRKFIGPPEKICQCPAGEKITDKTVYKNRNHHPTVKPVDLMRYLVRLVTPPGGIVLDPYMGSGTTGIAAVQQGFGFVGIERDPEYFPIAVARVEKALQQGVLGI